MLIQAGGCNGIDSALITIMDLNVYTIEFKEPGAKTSEPDLPKYREDGNLLVTAGFIDNYDSKGQVWYLSFFLPSDKFCNIYIYNSLF